MSCNQTREFIEPYLDGELSPDEITAYETHLEDCADCRGEHEARLRLRATVRVELDPAPPAGLEAAILRAVADTEATPGPSWRDALRAFLGWLRGPQLAPVAAAAVVVLVLVVHWSGESPHDAAAPFSQPGTVVVSRYGEVSPGGVPETGGLVLDGTL